MKPEMARFEIERFNKGDQRVYDLLFNHYYQQIAFFCWRLTQNEEQGKDIANDVFLKLWKARERLTSERHVYNFLYAVARNACTDYLRGIKRQQQSLREMIALANEVQEDPAIEQAEFIARIYEEVQQLPNRVREVFTLAYFEGLSNKEIAQKLNIDENNVRVNKTKALQLLRASILKKPDILLLAFLVSIADNLPN